MRFYSVCSVICQSISIFSSIFLLDQHRNSNLLCKTTDSSIPHWSDAELFSQIYDSNRFADIWLRGIWNILIYKDDYDHLHEQPDISYFILLYGTKVSIQRSKFHCVGYRPLLIQRNAIAAPQISAHLLFFLKHSQHFSFNFTVCVKRLTMYLCYYGYWPWNFDSIQAVKVVINFFAFIQRSLLSTQFSSSFRWRVFIISMR